MIRILLERADRLRQKIRERNGRTAQAAGRKGEDLAHRYLQGRGLVVAARNYRPPDGTGEIDLVCWEGETLVFVEVKTRATDEYGPPERAVDEEKRRAMVRCARRYAARARVSWERVRFDIVEVVLREPLEIRHLRQAFTPSMLGRWAKRGGFESGARD